MENYQIQTEIVEILKIVEIIVDLCVWKCRRPATHTGHSPTGIKPKHVNFPEIFYRSMIRKILNKSSISSKIETLSSYYGKRNVENAGRRAPPIDKRQVPETKSEQAFYKITSKHSSTLSHGNSSTGREKGRKEGKRAINPWRGQKNRRWRR